MNNKGILLCLFATPFVVAALQLLPTKIFSHHLIVLLRQPALLCTGMVMMTAIYAWKGLNWDHFALGMLLLFPWLIDIALEQQILCVLSWSFGLAQIYWFRHWGLGFLLLPLYHIDLIWLWYRPLFGIETQIGPISGLSLLAGWPSQVSDLVIPVLSFVVVGLMGHFMVLPRSQRAH